MMKYILILFLLMSAACAKLEVYSPDGTKASYSRHIFGQEIHGLKIHKDSNGTVEVQLDSQKSDAAIVAEITRELIPVISQYQNLMAITNAATLPVMLMQGKK